MSFWSFCSHEQTSPPDEMGEAICVSCGNRVRTTLTEANLIDTFERIYRDHGVYGRHSMRCVRSDLGWVCADDCTLS
jgi:hypothetical protein